MHISVGWSFLGIVLTGLTGDDEDIGPTDDENNALKDEVFQELKGSYVGIFWRTPTSGGLGNVSYEKPFVLLLFRWKKYGYTNDGQNSIVKPKPDDRYVGSVPLSIERIDLTDQIKHNNKSVPLLH